MEEWISGMSASINAYEPSLESQSTENHFKFAATVRKAGHMGKTAKREPESNRD